MQKPTYGKSSIGSLAARLPRTVPGRKLSARSATPAPPRPRPQINKPRSK